MRIALGIAVYTNNLAHVDYLQQTIQSINTTHELVFIPIINHINPASDIHPYLFKQEPTEIIELSGRQPQSVSRAWNDSIAEGITQHCEYILILNQDVLLGKNAIDTLITFAQANQGTTVIWTMADVNQESLDDTSEGSGGGPHFSAFMVHKSFPDIMGRFDENITPAYFEDNDMVVRIVKSGHSAIRCTTAKFYHYGSRVLQTDAEYQSGHSVRFMMNEAYFARKWGNRPLHTFDAIRSQMYEYPFNDPNKGINDWIPSDRDNQPLILGNIGGIPGTGLTPSTLHQQTTEMEKATIALHSNQNR